MYSPRLSLGLSRGIRRAIYTDYWVTQLRDPSIQVGDPRLFRLYDQTPVMERLQLTSKQITFNISGVQRSRFAPKEKFYLMQNSTYMLLFSRNINHLLVIHNCCYDVF